MKYDKMTKEQLIARISGLENRLEEIHKEMQASDSLQFPWIGNLGRWEFDVQANEVIFNDAKIDVLDYRREDVPKKVPYQFFTEKLHPEDYKRVMKNMLDHMEGRSPAYEVQYRIATRDGQYKWFYDRGIATSRDEDGRPLRVCGIVFDITAQKNMEEQLRLQNQRLRDMASTDDLTKVANRKTLMARLSAEIQRYRRGRGNLSLLMLDLDHFKAVNDNHGHVVGDEVLKHTAEVIEGVVREIDVVGRYGGEEFIVIMPDTASEEALVAAERVRETVAAATMTEGITVTVSGGLAQYGGESLERFIDRADEALYAAKDAGRNCIARAKDLEK